MNIRQNKWKLAVGTWLVLGVLLLSPLNAQTWKGSGAGSWSVGTNWVGDTAPASDGSANVSFVLDSTVIASTINAAWSADGSINSLNFSQPSGTATTISLLSDSTTPLSVGAGGITSTLVAGRTINLSTVTKLTASQTWNTGAGALAVGGGNAGTTVGSLSGESSVNVTKTGTGVLFFRGLASSTFAGSFTLNQGTLTFYNPSDLQALGTGSLILQNNGTTNVNFSSGGSMISSRTFFNQITFTDNSTGLFNLNAGGGSAGQSLSFTGNWSSTAAVSHGIYLASTANPTVRSFDSAFTYRLSGDNSGLTSSLASTTGAINVRSGAWVLDSANALGIGNSLSVKVGEISSSVAGVVSALWTNGYDVSSVINTATNGGTGGNGVVSIGNSKSSGTVKFTGNVNLTTGTASQVPLIYLASKTGSRANFQGTIADVGVGAAKSSVSIDGGGIVALSGNNTYAGGTTVINNSTLMIINTAGSATGTGVVTVESGSTLGGTGWVSPGGANGVIIQGGGFVSPGDNGTGTLTFNGASSSGVPLLTMSLNASFRFDLGAGEVSDAISFYNYIAGDFSLAAPGNSIDFTNVQAGSYLLFKFYSDAGNTFVASGLSSGLNIGAGLEGYTYQLSYDTVGQISLVVTAVPEPSSTAMIVLGGVALGLLSFRSRRRMV